MDLLFLNIRRELYPRLFTCEWLKDPNRQTMASIIKTISDELTYLENLSLVCNIVHYRMIVKESLKFAINAYF